MKKIALGLLIAATVSLTGCANAINDKKFNDIDLKKTPEGIKYKVFTVEDCKFIGTQDDDGVWQLAGPTSCSKQVSPGQQY